MKSDFFHHYVPKNIGKISKSKKSYLLRVIKPFLGTYAKNTFLGSKLMGKKKREIG
jgi:hypothetical protein